VALEHTNNNPPTPPNYEFPKSFSVLFFPPRTVKICSVPLLLSGSVPSLSVNCIGDIFPRFPDFKFVLKFTQEGIRTGHFFVLCVPSLRPFPGSGLLIGRGGFPHPSRVVFCCFPLSYQYILNETSTPPFFFCVFFLGMQLYRSFDGCHYRRTSFLLKTYLPSVDPSEFFHMSF